MSENGRSPAPASPRTARGLTLFLLALAVASGIACWQIKGWDVVKQTLIDDIFQIGSILPTIGVGMIISGCIQILSAHWPLARWLNGGSIWQGLAIATGAGAATPGGPFTAFPLVVALNEAGASAATLNAYITAWSVNGFQRVLVWEIPFMGPEFALLRFIVSIPLSFIAGLITRAMLKRRGGPTLPPPATP